APAARRVRNLLFIPFQTVILRRRRRFARETTAHLKDPMYPSSACGKTRDSQGAVEEIPGLAGGSANRQGILRLVSSAARTTTRSGRHDVFLAGREQQIPRRFAPRNDNP